MASPCISSSSSTLWVDIGDHISPQFTHTISPVNFLAAVSFPVVSSAFYLTSGYYILSSCIYIQPQNEAASVYPFSAKRLNKSEQHANADTAMCYNFSSPSSTSLRLTMST
jgi:hypothetical protein